MENLDPAKGLAPIQTRGPKKWPLKGTLAFVKSREGFRISFRPVLHGPQLESRYEGLMLHVSSYCLPISFCTPLPLSIRFPRQPLLDLSYPHDLEERILRFPLSGSFSYIQKLEGSKTLLTF